MLVWMISIFLIAFLALLIKPKNEENKKRFLIVSAIVLIVLMGCRNAQIHVGFDLNNYYRMYERAINSGWDSYRANQEIEIGYLITNFILAKIVPWPQFILFAHSAFCIGVYFYFIKKNTQIVDMAVLCFVSFGAFQFFLTGFRQSIAICVGLLMFEVAKEKKWLLYIVLFIIAISFHRTAVVLAPIYMLVNLKNTAVNNAVVLVSSAVLIFFSDKLFELGSDLFDRQYGSNYHGNALGGMVPVLIYLMALILCFVNSKNFNPQTGYGGLVRLLIVGTITYLMRYEAVIMERISMYFTVAAVPLLSENLGRFIPGKDRQVAKLFCVLCCLGLYFWRVSTQYGEYVFFWQ